MPKKVFLINFSTPILIEVARNLKRQGVEITYWQGYRDDFENLVKNKDDFSNTIFHHIYDAKKNIPPSNIDISNFDPVDKELIEALYPAGWQSLAMMERADLLSSPLAQKRNCYYQYLKFWQGMLAQKKPDAVLWPNVPHSALDYALYGLAKKVGVKILILDQQTIANRALIITDYENYPLSSQAKGNIITNLENLSPDLKKYYDTQINPLADATPDYKKKHIDRQAPFRTPDLKKITRSFFHLTFFRLTKFYLEMLFTKRQLGSFHKDLYGWKLKWLFGKWAKIQRKARNEYLSLQIIPNLNKKFIYVPLNFQPEMTTCPMGGFFDDQLLMIDILASALPSDWILCVKEHQPQWRPNSYEAHLYRYEGYYRQIAKLKNVYLVPVEFSTFDLINACQAVATATGTAGWEAVLRSKPALVFGYSWYRNCEGVFPISNLSSCRQAIDKIRNGYQVNKGKVIYFLADFDKHSFLAKDYKTRIYPVDADFSSEENIKNITKAFLSALISF